jgi:phospholipase/carboxylesterase
MIPDRIQQLEIKGVHFKLYRPESRKPEGVIWLNHGWTGDENSMWVFTGTHFQEFMIIAPRAPHPSANEQHGGYSWVPQSSGKWSTLAELQPSVDLLEMLIQALAHRYSDTSFDRVRMAGFSQGAALSFAYALLYPNRIDRLAGLAGFLPTMVGPAFAESRIKGMPVFIAHGTEDDRVPIEKAREARIVWQKAGAAVEYCESPVAHKLGANCLREFKSFMIQKIP